jgi:hypothetical protein
MERHGKPPVTCKMAGSPLIAGFDEIFTHERIILKNIKKKIKRKENIQDAAIDFFLDPRPLVD